MAKSIKAGVAANVDEYLDALTPAVKKVLQQLRQQIKQAAPKAEELISYQIPTYRQGGPLIHFAAFKNHCSLIGVSRKMIESFSKELKDFPIKGTTIHFTAENPLPAMVVKKLVKARIAENEARVKSKS